VDALRGSLRASAAADADRRAEALAFVEPLVAPESADVKRVCDIKKGRVPRPKTLTAHVQECALEALEQDVSYPALITRQYV